MATDDGGTTDIGGSGYDLDELSAYLDRGREPAIAAIDGNAECQAVLASMERFGSLSRDLVARDVATAPALDESWFAALMSTVARELRAGRDIDFPDPDPATRLSITEGAVREVVRAAGDSVAGVLVGSVRLGVVDAVAPGAGGPVDVHVSISVAFRAPLPDVARTVRTAVHTALLTHTPLAIGEIDITVDDVFVATSDDPATDGGTP